MEECLGWGRAEARRAHCLCWLLDCLLRLAQMRVSCDQSGNCSIRTRASVTRALGFVLCPTTLLIDFRGSQHNSKFSIASKSSRLTREAQLQKDQPDHPHKVETVVALIGERSVRQSVHEGRCATEILSLCGGAGPKAPLPWDSKNRCGRDQTCSFGACRQSLSACRRTEEATLLRNPGAKVRLLRRGHLLGWLHE